MIRQVTEAVHFATPTSRLVVPLLAPTAKGTILVAVFVIAATGAPTPAIRVVPDMTPSRWIQANDTMLPSGGRLAYWARIGSHAGIAEIIAETARPVTGTGRAMETAGLSVGDAIQALADLIAGVE